MATSITSTQRLALWFASLKNDAKLLVIDAGIIALSFIVWIPLSAFGHAGIGPIRFWMILLILLGILHFVLWLNTQRTAACAIALPGLLFVVLMGTGMTLRIFALVIGMIYVEASMLVLAVYFTVGAFLGYLVAPGQEITFKEGLPAARTVFYKAFVIIFWITFSELIITVSAPHLPEGLLFLMIATALTMAPGAITLTGDWGFKIALGLTVIAFVVQIILAILFLTGVIGLNPVDWRKEIAGAIENHARVTFYVGVCILLAFQAYLRLIWEGTYGLHHQGVYWSVMIIATAILADWFIWWGGSNVTARWLGVIATDPIPAREWWRGAFRSVVFLGTIIVVGSQLYQKKITDGVVTLLVVFFMWLIIDQLAWEHDILARGKQFLNETLPPVETLEKR